MKKFNKYIVNEFKSGFGRFIAIMAIVALGVGFLIGVLQATPDMKSTMSNYYIRNNALHSFQRIADFTITEAVGSSGTWARSWSHGSVIRLWRRSSCSSRTFR